MSFAFWAAAARWALVAVFAASAFTKLGRRVPRRERTEELARLGLPPIATPTLAVVLPFVELGLAALLLAPWRWPVACAVGFLALATVVLIRAVAAGVREPCRCFGSFSARPVSAVTLVRNALLLGLAALAWWAPAAIGGNPGAGVVGIFVGFALMFLG